uniref:winged helix-turn-helix domain-containing protein n=1 Tax=Trichocoleus desertorum TaxID=1481672 RepID=UPI0036F3EBE5
MARQRPLSPSAQKTLEAVKANPGLAAPDLAERSGISETLVRRNLAILRVRKLIQMQESGHIHHWFPAEPET